VPGFSAAHFWLRQKRREQAAVEQNRLLRWLFYLIAFFLRIILTIIDVCLLLSSFMEATNIPP
jgi:heme/copper-type cytochrome/quinol oxidase subunit 4